MYIELHEDELKKILIENPKAMVQFGAGWCGTCRIMKPKFKNLATLGEEVALVYVDAEKFPESRKMAQVDNLPTFAAFVDGTLKRQIQTNQVESLKELYHEITNH